MRARNLKPGLFLNETLGTADPLYSLIFEGLWCMADREGRLEDRPLRIHAGINPYRPSASTVQALDWLVQHRFVIRYSVGSDRYLAVVNFREHQQPHMREASSKIPPPPESSGNQGNGSPESGHGTSTVQSTVQAPEEPGSSRSDSPFLIPSSLTPVSDSLRIESDTDTAAAPPRVRKRVPRGTSEPDPDWWLDFKLAYPVRAGDLGKRKAIRAAHERIREGHDPEEFIAGAKRYAAFCEANGWVGTIYVKQASTFLGPDKPFLETWDLPIIPTGPLPPVRTWRPTEKDSGPC